MRKIILRFLIFFAGFLSAQELPNVTIVNNTGYTIYELYISQTTNDNWEKDVLGEDILSNGQSFNVKLSSPLSVANRYDIQLIDEDGDSYTKWNVLITPNARIVFTLSDIDED